MTPKPASIAALVLAVLAGALALAATAVAQDCGYGRQFCQPVASTGPVGDLTDTGATLTGTVNPGGNATTYAFQVAETAAFTSSQVFPAQAASAGSGTADVPVAVSAAGLEPGTRYFVRLAASSPVGGSFGAPVEFTTTTDGSTTPFVMTGAASMLTSTSAKVRGSIDPVGHEVTYSFAYGPTRTYGGRTPNGTVPAGDAPVTVTGSLAGLLPGTTYHYRLVTVNARGTTAIGVDRTFTTALEDPPERVRPRGVTLRVSPRRARRAPFAYTARGRLLLPAGMSSDACAGKVRITVTQGGEELRRRGTRVRSNCRFTRVLVIEPEDPSGRARVIARFRGTSRLMPRGSRSRVVRYGPGR